MSKHLILAFSQMLPNFNISYCCMITCMKFNLFVPVLVIWSILKIMGSVKTAWIVVSYFIYDEKVAVVQPCYNSLGLTGLKVPTN